MLRVEPQGSQCPCCIKVDQQSERPAGEQQREQLTETTGENDTTLFPRPSGMLPDNRPSLLKVELLCDNTRTAPRATMIQAARPRLQWKIPENKKRRHRPRSGNQYPHVTSRNDHGKLLFYRKHQRDLQQPRVSRLDKQTSAIADAIKACERLRSEP